MASILNRYEAILKTNVEALIDFAEDPMKMARHLAHHLEDDLARTQREGAALLAEIEGLRSATEQPNADGLLAAKTAELEKLQEIHDRLEQQIHWITEKKLEIHGRR